MSKNFKQWYAMRKSLQEKGKWTHGVPRQEEGEPPTKKPRAEPTPTPTPTAAAAAEEDSDDSIPPLEDPPTAEGRMSLFTGSTGFTLIAWVREDSPLLGNLSEEASTQMQNQLLNDFTLLLSVRWNMEFNIAPFDNTLYAFGQNNRITVSDRTVKNAIGELSNHVEFLRGSVKTSPQDLARYRECRKKWRVPDQTSDTSYGSEDTEYQGTSPFAKRKRT